MKKAVDVKVDLTWLVGAGGRVVLDTEGTHFLDAVMMWRGRKQIRDVTVRSDGSVLLGSDKLRASPQPPASGATDTE